MRAVRAFPRSLIQTRKIKNFRAPKLFPSKFIISRRTHRAPRVRSYRPSAITVDTRILRGSLRASGLCIGAISDSNSKNKKFTGTKNFAIEVQHFSTHTQRASCAAVRPWCSHSSHKKTTREIACERSVHLRDQRFKLEKSKNFGHQKNFDRSSSIILHAHTSRRVRATTPQGLSQ